MFHRLLRACWANNNPVLKNKVNQVSMHVTAEQAETTTATIFTILRKAPTRRDLYTRGTSEF